MNKLQEIRDALERVIEASKSGVSNKAFDVYKQNEADCLTLRHFLDALIYTHVLVPKEPTEEMLVAGEKEVPFVYDMYTAMIAAAQEKNDE